MTPARGACPASASSAWAVAGTAPAAAAEWAWSLQTLPFTDMPGRSMLLIRQLAGAP